MWLLPVLLLWVPSGEQADLTKAVITLHPPWVNVFPEEDVTLQCEGPSVPGDNSTLWFHNSSVFQTLTPRYSFTVASVNDSGEYRCQTALSVPSDPVQLEVHRDWLLLQVSNRAFTEGEPLALRCHGWKNLKVFNIVFYQNGKSFKFSPFQNELTILKTNLSHNGIYHCSGKRKHLYTSAEVSITVKELFPAPVLKTSVSLPLLEGNLLNLSCETKLLLQRPGLQLYFSFYMGNKTLKGRDTSSEYQILSVKTENSGLYWCKAATEDGNVIKSSPELALLVLGHESQNPVWFHVFFYLIMGIIFLVCTILGVTMRKKLRERNHFDLKILASTCGAKITSYFRKDGYLVEELNYWEQDDKQQHEGIDMKQLQEKEQQ